MSIHRNSAAETVEQQLLFVGSENGKLLAMRNLIKQVSDVLTLVIWMSQYKVLHHSKKERNLLNFISQAHHKEKLVFSPIIFITSHTFLSGIFATSVGLCSVY